MKDNSISTLLCICTLVLLLFATHPAAADTTVGGAITTDTTWTLAGSPLHRYRQHHG